MKIRIQTTLAYRFNVISTILIQCLIMYAMSCFWIAAYGYGAAETVSGISRNDMITYTIISVIMGNLLTMGVQNRIARSVRSGSVALDLLKPVNIYGIYLAEDLGDCLAAFFQKAIPLLLVGTLMFGFPAPASLLHFVLFLFSFCIGYLINWILAALLGLCAFKTLTLGLLANAKRIYHETVVRQYLSPLVLPARIPCCSGISAFYEHLSTSSGNLYRSIFDARNPVPYGTAVDMVCIAVAFVSQSAKKNV